MCTELEHSHRGWTQISYKNILSECDSGICFDLSCFLFVIDFPPTERGGLGRRNILKWPGLLWQRGFMPGIGEFVLGGEKENESSAHPKFQDFHRPPFRCCLPSRFEQQEDTLECDKSSLLRILPPATTPETHTHTHEYTSHTRLSFTSSFPSFRH